MGLVINKDKPETSFRVLTDFPTSTNEQVFKWIFLVDLEIEMDVNGRDHTITFSTATYEVEIVGLTLRKLFEGLKDETLTLVWRDAVGSVTDPADGIVRTITIRPRP
jgi:hypothetical protein